MCFLYEIYVLIIRMFYIILGAFILGMMGRVYWVIFRDFVFVFIFILIAIFYLQLRRLSNLTSLCDLLLQTWDECQ
jgi:hypothetical protein